VPKRSPGGLLLAIGFLLIGGYLLFSGIRNLTDNKSPLVMPNRQRLKAEIADDQNERQQGLSGRDKLADDGAMLFKFEQASDGICFWMKDMKFPIDMIWLDTNKKVVTVRSNVAPETYPNSFCPDSPAKYVIEIPAGKSEEYGLKAGAEVRF
jgi:uncharacterized protein